MEVADLLGGARRDFFRQSRWHIPPQAAAELGGRACLWLLVAGN